MLIHFNAHASAGAFVVSGRLLSSLDNFVSLFTREIINEGAK